MKPMSLESRLKDLSNNMWIIKIKVKMRKFNLLNLGLIYKIPNGAITPNSGVETPSS